MVLSAVALPIGKDAEGRIVYKFLYKMVDYLKKALIYGHTSRISSRIYYQFTTFEGKRLDMPPGILQAPISAQY
jgi:hypothetical protein